MSDEGESESKTEATSTEAPSPEADDAEPTAAPNAASETASAEKAEVSAEPATTEDEKPAGPAPAPAPAKPPRAPLAVVNDVLFTLEQGMVAFFLLAIAFMVFVDVVQRRLVAPDSKLADLLDGPLFFLDRGTVELIAPYLGAAAGLGVLVFAYRAAEKQRGKPILSAPGSAWILGVGTAVLFALVGYLIVAIPSWIVYLVFWFGGLAFFTATTVREKADGWTVRLGIAWGLLTPAIVYVATTWFPEGYSWAKEVALVMTLWVGLFGASVCVHEGKHIRLEALEKSHPTKAKKALTVISRLVAATFTAFMAYLSWRYLFKPEGGMFYVPMRLEQTRIPIWFEMLAVPLAFGLTTARLVASALSAALGGTYGDAAKAEGMEEAEKLAAERAKAEGRTLATEKEKEKSPVTFIVVLAIIVVAAFFGPAGVLVSVILAGALLAQPLFVVLGAVVLVCFAMWGSASEPFLDQVSPLVERIAGLADNPALLAIPLFISSGAVMAHGDISKKLIRFAQSVLGWLPGGLAISAVFACMIFAAISGSSPATVIAIGGVMAPALIRDKYKPEFAHGLVTSSGSLGILIPPSIPMIVYQIVNTRDPIRVEDLFAAGWGPGMVIGGVLMGYSLYRGFADGTPRQKFSGKEVLEAGTTGFWALMFPILIMGGITTGIFNAVESAAVSVVYAIAVEVWVHRAIKLGDLPKIMQEVGVMLGSFLVILVVAICFGEFLEVQGIPRLASDWISSMDLERWQFLLVVNLLLLVVGCLMDIMSAIFVFVPLLAPMASALGIDPLHFAIIFIVNLEIGYLTPPVGLNLFVASTLFGKPVDYMIRSVLPFIGLMFIGLLIITYYPPLSGDLGRWLNGSPPWTWTPPLEGETGTGEIGEDEEEGEETEAPSRPACDPPEDLNCDGNVTMEEITAFSEMGEGGEGELEEEEAPATPACDPPEDLNCDGNVTMEEITEYTSM